MNPIQWGKYLAVGVKSSSGQDRVEPAVCCFKLGGGREMVNGARARALIDCADCPDCPRRNNPLDYTHVKLR
jgi:hypothetical protein